LYAQNAPKHTLIFNMLQFIKIGFRGFRNGLKVHLLLKVNALPNREEAKIIPMQRLIVTVAAQRIKRTKGTLYAVLKHVNRRSDG
jgi:hypothetical protein